MGYGERGQFRGDDGGQRGGFRGGFGRGAPMGERKKFKAVCSDCGKECEVPFEPSPGRPVYCGDCYKSHRPPRRDDF